MRRREDVAGEDNRRDGSAKRYRLGRRTTAVKHGIDITHVLSLEIFPSSPLWRKRAGDWDVWETSLHNPDFSEYANLCGALGIRVTDEAHLDDALARALSHEGPSLVEVMTDAKLI